MKNLEDVFQEIENELNEVQEKFGQFNSKHEFWGVLQEELIELFDEIRFKVSNKENMKKEAIQVAAMVIKFIQEMC